MVNNFGTIELGNNVIVSDPCYESTNFYNRLLRNVKSGIYNCIVASADFDWWGERTRSIVVMHNKYKATRKDWRLIGRAGVDSGQMGIYDKEYFVSKDGDEKEWYDDKDTWYKNLCTKNEFDDRGVILDNKGVVCHSGYGDGIYNVYAIYNSKDEIVGIKVRFI